MAALHEIDFSILRRYASSDRLESKRKNVELLKGYLLVYLRIRFGIRCGRVIGRVEMLRHGLEFLHVQAGIARRRHFAFDAQVLEDVADVILVVHATRTEEGLDGVLETLEPSVNFQQIDRLAEKIHRQVEGSRSWDV